MVVSIIRWFLVIMPMNIHATSLSRSRNTAKNHLFYWEVDRQIFTTHRYGEVKRQICLSYLRKADLPSLLLGLYWLFTDLAPLGRFGLVAMMSVLVYVRCMSPSLLWGPFRGLKKLHGKGTYIIHRPGRTLRLLDPIGPVGVFRTLPLHWGFCSEGWACLVWVFAGLGVLGLVMVLV